MTNEELGEETAGLILLFLEIQTSLSLIRAEAARRLGKEKQEVPEVEDSEEDAKMIEALNAQIAMIPNRVLREWAEELRDGMLLHQEEHRANRETTVDCDENEENSVVLFAILERYERKAGMN